VASDLIASIVLAIWLYLVLARGGFWQTSGRIDDLPPAEAAASAAADGQQDPPAQARWPAIAAIIPARDEAACVAETVKALLRQNYPGDLRVILIDDQSRDATAEVARQTAVELGKSDRLTVLAGRALPAGWTGKLWAQHQGVQLAAWLPRPPSHLLFTDADIVYGPDALLRLAAKARAGGYALTSLMVKLRCESLAERAFIPAFIFFFQLLYPFSRSNNPRRAVAAAAGGCMLVRRDALDAAGGLEAIRSALIDDCALAKLLKARGPIWIGLTDIVHSIRGYPSIAGIRHMVSRTAYAQLRYSPLVLLGAVLGLAITYLAPVGLAFLASGVAQFIGIFAWLLMAFALQPTLRFYRLTGLWGLALPAIAAVYMAFTLDSAYQHARGRGGMWKGRAQASMSELR
jgi:hopene-associated glycosyltransferase HpnB